MSDMNLRTVATVVEGDMSLELKKSTIAIILKALSMLEEELEVNISTSPTTESIWLPDIKWKFWLNDKLWLLDSIVFLFNSKDSDYVGI